MEDGLCASVTQVETPHGPIGALAHEDAVVQLALHAAGHGVSRLMWLVVEYDKDPLEDTCGPSIMGIHHQGVFNAESPCTSANHATDPVGEPSDAHPVWDEVVTQFGGADHHTFDEINFSEHDFNNAMKVRPLNYDPASLPGGPNYIPHGCPSYEFDPRSTTDEEGLLRWCAERE